MLQLARSHGLDIFQPAVRAGPVSWPITRRQPGQLLHRRAPAGSASLNGAPCGNASAPSWVERQPPCERLVEVMAPVFSRDAWRCVWAILPNDLVHGWGLDLTWHRCASPTGMAVIDAYAVDHMAKPTLGGGLASDPPAAGSEGGVPSLRERVDARRRLELDLHMRRWGADAAVVEHADGVSE